MKSAPEKNGIRIGDYQMINDAFVHPTKKIAKTKVRGIVCGFYKNESPIICALEVFKEVWNTNCYSGNGKHVSKEKSRKLFNGREVTAQYKEQIKDRDRRKFGALERCINYRRDKKENWYLGSLGEIMTMLDNAAYLHAAYKITGLGFIIDAGYVYWSCSEMNSYNSWGSGFFAGRIWDYCCLKGKTHLVVPFYASTK